MRHHAWNRGALAFAAILLAACGGEMPPTAPALPGAQMNEFEVISDDTLWASDEVYAGPLDEEPSAGVMMVEAAAAQPNIRIGVVQQSSIVYLGATSAWTIRDKANGVTVMAGDANTAAAVTLASVPERYIYFQVTCSGLAGVNTLKAKAEALGYLTFTESALPAANCTRLLVGRIPFTPDTAVVNGFERQLMAQGIAPANGTATPRSVTVGNQVVYRITRGSVSVQNLNPVVVTAAPGGYVMMGTTPGGLRRYRGRGEARINSAASLAGINDLPMEQYLYGVVPQELGPELFPEFEAQKAQAIVARTYALAGMGKRSADGYDLRATTDDQVYGGFPVEHPVSNAAIDATAGIVVTYGGRLISTNFFSTSGGHTANNEESFVGSPLPYQRGVPDAERGRALERVPTLEVFRAHANPTSLRNVKEGDFQATRETWHRWTYEWTAEEISAMISSWAGMPVGRVHSIDVVERGPSGRAITVEYRTDAGTFSRSRGMIRSTLLYLNASRKYVDLPSTLFFVEPVREAGQLTGGFRVYGGGFGHGVGMAQVGAVGMAERGHSHDEILRHYFQGIALAPAY